MEKNTENVMEIETVYRGVHGVGFPKLGSLLGPL